MADAFDDLDLARTIGAKAVLAGRYRIVRELGRGGMGIVYLAEDLHLEGRRVAVKMLPPVLSTNARALAALKREALLAMELSHPHVVTLRAFEQAEEGAFLVMDYVEGRSLEDLLAERGTLSEEEVAGIFRPVAEALDYAHGRGIVHRDVKPSNILIGPDGGAQVMDFGIAREMKDTFTRVTGKGASGTLPYMSPEQLRGEPAAPAQDIYSLAATIYECLAGRPPFARGQIDWQIVHQPPEPIEGASERAASAVLAGLAKQPEDRPPTAGELIDRLAGRDGGTVPVSRSQPTPRQYRVAAVVILALLAAGAVAGLLILPELLRQRQPPSPPPVAASPQAKRLGDYVTVDNAVKVAKGAKSVWQALRPNASTQPGETPAGPEPGTPAYARLIAQAKSVLTSLPALGTDLTPAQRQQVQTALRAIQGTLVLRPGDGEALTLKLKLEASLGPPKDLTLDLGGGVTMKLVLIPASKFMMGSPETEEGRLSYEGPQREATISKPFYMGVYEVTQEQYEKLIGQDPSPFHGKANPVDCVSWEDAAAFCRALSRKTGRTVRLPMETEWEYACRAGTSTPFHTGATIGTDQANYNGGYTYGDGKKGQYRKQTTAVGSFKPNAWGLFDMHGNVWEWCAEWYAGSHANVKDQDPQGPASGPFRVLRGGSWDTRPAFCRSAIRNWSAPDDRYYDFGFRVAADVK